MKRCIMRHFIWVSVVCKMTHLCDTSVHNAISSWERSGSVEECFTRDQEAAGSSLTGGTVLWSLSKTHLS